MIPPIDSTDSTEDSLPCKKLSDWMAQLPAHLTQIPISRLQIPGSHDSGADDSLSVDLPVANDDQGKLAALGKSKCVRQIIKKWAVTQRLDILEQLQAGIRYFDLRVSHPPEKVQEKAGDFLIVHALYGPLLSTVLLNIRTFLDQYTQEVVLLDFNHLYGMTEDSDVALTALIGRCLGWHRICPPMDPVDCTLDNLRQLGYRVLVFYPSPPDSAPFWPQSAIINPWPRTDKTDRLVKFITKNLLTVRPKCPDMFFVTQGVLTPEASDIILSPASSLEKKFSLKANSAVAAWLEGLKPQLTADVNIVMTDFVDDHFARSIVELNFRHN